MSDKDRTEDRDGTGQLTEDTDGTGGTDGTGDKDWDRERERDRTGDRTADRGQGRDKGRGGERTEDRGQRLAVLTPKPPSPHPKTLLLPKRKSCSKEVEADGVESMKALYHTVDYCRHGTPWRKRTRFAVWGKKNVCTELRLLCSSKGGMCDITGKQHHRLSGWVRGQAITSQAEEYPAGVATAIARHLACA